MNLYRSRLSFNQDNEGDNLSGEVDTVSKSASDLAVYSAENGTLEWEGFHLQAYFLLSQVHKFLWM